MDPDRVRAYLQISCAGLGFDIGELWWTFSKDSGSTSALAAIGMLGRCVFEPHFWRKKNFFNSSPSKAEDWVRLLSHVFNESRISVNQNSLFPY